MKPPHFSNFACEQGHLLVGYPKANSTIQGAFRVGCARILPMSEWEFLHGLTGQELDDAMSTGATAQEWAWIEAREAQQAEERAAAREPID